MPYPFLDLARANAPIMDKLVEAATAVIRSGRYLRGEQTNLLERELAALCGVNHCVAVSNGLDALRLILRAYIELGRIRRGDQVIVPANTYVATVLAVTDSGLEPVLCDANPKTLNLDTSQIEPLLGPRVKAIMPVHLYGTPCWDNTLSRLARERGLLIIEDNAQAIGAQADCEGLNGTLSTGGLGHAAGHSFYPTKNLGALGDAGAVTTSDNELANAVRAIANYGSDRRYHNIYPGLNCRIDEIQAAMLRVALQHLPQETARRQAVAAAYHNTITNRLILKPEIFGNMRQVWHQYVVRVNNRQRFIDHLTAHGVGSDIHYATPPYRQPVYANAPFANTHFPISDAISDQAVSLPIAYPITAENATEIAKIINNYVL